MRRTTVLILFSILHWGAAQLFSPDQASIFGAEDNSLTVEPSEINQEHQYEKYENFPVPKLENVYKAWKPVDYGHPLKDETLYYRPPSVERVRFRAEFSGPQSRSIDDQVFQEAPTRPIVIQAEAKEKPPKSGYSVYGSPDINYSALYTSPAPQKKSLHSHFPSPSRNNPSELGFQLPSSLSIRDDPRENPLLFHSAADSRSADTRDYPLLWGHYGREPQSALEPVKSTGMHMIKPPTKPKKKPTEYFYYSQDSPHYKDKLSKKPNKEEHEVDNEIVSIDGIIVGPRNSLTTPKPPVPRKPSLKYPEDLQTSASEIRRNNPGPPPTNIGNNKANAVVYSFKNDYGQREHVGVIFDQPPEASQINKVLPSNKAQVLNPRIDIQDSQFRPHTRFNHPTNNQQPTRPKKPSKANFIPLLDKKPAGNKPKKEVSFPLGNPFISPLLKARPEFFPALHYPPLYKTRPAKLEGSFGPKLPPKPEPDVILFPDEELPGVVRERTNNHNQDFLQPISTPVVQSRENDQYVYKSVRDMDYSRPRDILSVKPSGELYIPEAGTENKPLGDSQPRVPILPGISTLEDYENLDVADDRLWLPDFSDTDSENLSENAEGPPTLADVFGAGINQPLDLDTGSSIRDQVVFKEDSYKRPGSSFKFPGQSTLDEQQNNRQPPPALLRRPSGAVKVQHQNQQGQQPPSGVKVQQVQPNYSVVIGLTYDDDNSDSDYDDFDGLDYNQQQTTTAKPFGKKELYELCVAEVPKHLHYELCGYIRDGKIPPSRNSAKNIQPLDSKLIQGSNHRVKPPKNPFAGIPTELPVQIRQPNNQPLVITGNSRVKVYKPYEESPLTVTTTTRPTTTSTTTIRTTTTTTASRLENRPRRPLVFNKRDPNTGESRLSQPFEYFNRLTQFFSNRVRTPPSGSQQNQRQRYPGPPPPRLQRQRLPIPSS